MAVGLRTGRQLRPQKFQEPWTQAHATSSGGEPQEVRYHVVIVAEPRGDVQHLVNQWRPGEGEPWTSARRTLCDVTFVSLASSVAWGTGMWCPFCRDILRAVHR